VTTDDKFLHRACHRIQQGRWSRHCELLGQPCQQRQTPCCPITPANAVTQTKPAASGRSAAPQHAYLRSLLFIAVAESRRQSCVTQNVQVPAHTFCSAACIAELRT